MKWFKPMFLTAAMALVTWGVWHTLTQHSHSHSGPGEPSDPGTKWKRDVSARGKAEGGSTQPGTGDAGHEANRASTEPFAFNAVGGGAGSAVIGAFDAGPPLPAPKDPIRDATAPRVGEQMPATSQPKEIATASTANLETQRLNDQFDTAIKGVKDLIAARQLVPAYEQLSSWHARRDELTLARTEQMLKELDGLAGEIVYSPRSHLSPAYSVAPSDTLSRIATPHTIPPELLAKINSIARPDQLRPGQQLKVVHGPFHAEIRLSKFELTLLIGKKMLYGGRFRIGLGSEGPSLPGTYTVVTKKMFPDYWPDRKSRPDYKIPGGDRLNALGTRLIVFLSADGQHDGAIHGTVQPTSIGGQCQEGSIRLAKEDIENIFDMLVENESKIIVRN